MTSFIGLHSRCQGPTAWYYPGDMVTNRSVPVETILPHVTYTNVGDAIPWLQRVFGFTEHYRYGAPNGPADGAQLSLGRAWIMLKAARSDRTTPAKVGCCTQTLTV